MDDKNTVKVRVYGQEYAVSGNMQRDYILKLADFVDGKMREVGSGTNYSMTGVAVLAAMIIADESFSKEKDLEDFNNLTDELKGRAAKFEELWNQAQQNIARYKEDSDKLPQILHELNEEKKFNEVLRGRVEELTARAEEFENAPAQAQKTIQDLEAKCRDIESSFFDIQMENIHLKNELEALKRQR
jgi:cell division protein ZapA